MPTCTECGEEFSAGAFYCRECGAELPAEELDPAVRTISSGKGSRLTTAVYVSLGLFVLFYLSVGLLLDFSGATFLTTALLGLLLLPLALLLPMLAYFNVLRIRDRLYDTIGFLPGFRSQTTWKAALGIFGYTLLASMVLLSIAVMVLPPDNIDVSDTALSSQEVTAGDSIEVSGVVENVGNETLSETIELTANGEVIETKEVTLEPGEQLELTFNTQLSDPGEYEIELHDSTIATVVVHNNIVFDETTLSEEEIGEGQSVEITGVVANVGNTSDSRTFVLRIDGEVVESKEITLDPGEEHEIRFTRAFDERGEYEIEINNDLGGTLVVVEPGSPEADSWNPNLDNPEGAVETWYSLSEDSDNFDEFAEKPETLIHTKSVLLDMFKQAGREEATRTDTFETVEVEAVNEQIDREELEEKFFFYKFVAGDIDGDSQGPELIEARKDIKERTEKILDQDTRVVKATVKRSGANNETKEIVVKWYVAKEDGNWKVVASGFEEESADGS